MSMQNRYIYGKLLKLPYKYEKPLKLSHEYAKLLQEREKPLKIPHENTKLLHYEMRRMELLLYEGEIIAHTPPQRTSGVWGGKAAVPYPAVRKQRGLKTEVGELPAIWKDLKYYEESGRKNEVDGRNL